MNKMDLKKRLLEVCINRQQETAAELQHEVDETLGSPTNMVPPKTATILSVPTMNQNIFLAKQLSQANTLLVTLQKFPWTERLQPLNSVP